VYTSEVEIAVATVREVARLTRALQQEIVAARAQVAKEDRTPVTVADLAVQIVVSHRLATAFPADPLLAEEDSRPLLEAPALADQVFGLAGRSLPRAGRSEMVAALDRGGHGGGRHGRFWILDPVDGTKGFLRGEQYAIALALVEEGQVVVGVLGCPNLPAQPGRPPGCLLAALRGGGAHQVELDGSASHPVRVDDVDDPARAVLCESVESGHSSHEHTDAIAERLGMTAPTVRMDSQCKYAVVARGEASLYLRLPRAAGYREKSWDHAAGALVITEAGGRVTDLDALPLDFSHGALLGVANGILASNGRLHDRVLAAARAHLGLPALA
jgi:HAL2 family 3'(2'),5'-bisphosphate nucleotidase